MHRCQEANKRSFGRTSRVTKPAVLQNNFHQAVVEIHALKQAGRDLDISKQANRGIYNAPDWIQNVKLQRDGQGKVVLAFPSGQSLESLLAEMERVPDYAPPASEPLEEVPLEELLAEEGAPVAPVVQEPPPTMDPATPAFKRAALVKEDAEKKFDFMSNRPVPRKIQPAEPEKPVEPVAEVVETVQVVVEEPVAAAPALDVEAALATSSTTLNELRHAVLEAAARSSEESVSAIRNALRNSTTSTTSQNGLHVQPDTRVKWQQVPLDIELKFSVRRPLLCIPCTITDIHSFPSVLPSSPVTISRTRTSRLPETSATSTTTSAVPPSPRPPTSTPTSTPKARGKTPRSTRPCAHTPKAPSLRSAPPSPASYLKRVMSSFLRRSRPRKIAA
jgi:hypothetical protein